MPPTSSKSCFCADLERSDLHKSKFFSCSHDEDSQKAMMALANTALLIDGSFRCGYSPPEGNLRAMGRSEIEKTLQVPEAKGTSDNAF